MPPRPRKRPLVIVGPTAGGKSALAVALAQRLHTTGIDDHAPHILSADSMQVYRHMDAGTAKPTADERAAAVHHLIDIVEPDTPWTVADWLAAAEPLIDRLLHDHIRPIVVGGTSLYLKALLEGLDPQPAADAALRAEAQTLGDRELWDRLHAVDPDAAAGLAVGDRRRVIRALEVVRATGQPVAKARTSWDQPADVSRLAYRRDPILLGLRWPTEAINRRINARVKQMFDKLELVEEVRELDAAGKLGPQAAEALGYKQVLAWQRGSDDRIRSRDDALEQTKIRTRRYAKQQRTWLRRWRGVHWLDAEGRTADALAAEAAEAVAADCADDAD
jgi:tRNA dimethylallyltransferase